MRKKELITFIYNIKNTAFRKRKQGKILGKGATGLYKGQLQVSLLQGSAESAGDKRLLVLSYLKRESMEVLSYREQLIITR